MIGVKIEVVTANNRWLVDVSDFCFTCFFFCHAEHERLTWFDITPHGENLLKEVKEVFS